MDNEKKYLYIFTDTFALTYPTKTVHDHYGVAGANFPPISSNPYSVNPNFASITGVNFHNNVLFITADNNIYVFFTTNG